jgi:hypothetical protein
MDLLPNEGPMIDLKTIQRELAQARQARIEAELAGCELEELADDLRRTHVAWTAPQFAPRREGGLHLFVFSP